MEANKIDKFYKESLSGYEYKLSGSAFWRKLKWRLFWIDFKYYFIGAGVLAIIGAGIFFGLSDPASSDIPNSTIYYQTAAHSYQLTVLQTVSHDSYKAEQEILLPELLTNTPDYTKPPNKENIEFVQVFDRNTNGGREQNTSEIVFESTTVLVTPIVREKLSLIPMESATASILNQFQPELIYDSVNQLYIPDNKVHVSLGLYVSPAYNVSSLKSDGGYEDYQHYRNNNESPSFSFSAGIDLQVNIKNWYVQTGLAYSKFNNNRNYNHTFLAYDSLRSYYTNDTTWGWLYDPPDIGKPVVIGIDTVWVPVYNDLNEGKNEWNYLEIPLLVGYKFNKSRFSFDIATGFSYGVLINVTGNVPSLTQENMFTELSEMGGVLNKNQFNYILQLGLSYHVTPKWSIMAKPYYKQNLKSVFNNTYPVDQRFRSFGIKFGLIVDL